MKIGPGRKMKSASRWFQIDEPGDVGGHQVGRELDPVEADAGHLREGPRCERLREPRVVLEQHVAVGEQAHQDELERLALADDGALDLVEDPRRVAPGPGRAPSERSPVRRRRAGARRCRRRRRSARSAARDRRGRSPMHRRRVRGARRRGSRPGRFRAGTPGARSRSGQGAGAGLYEGRRRSRGRVRPRAPCVRARGSAACDARECAARRRTPTAARGGSASAHRREQLGRGRSRRARGDTRARRGPHGRARPGARLRARAVRKRGNRAIRSARRI